MLCVVEQQTHMLRMKKKNSLLYSFNMLEEDLLLVNKIVSIKEESAMF